MLPTANATITRATCMSDSGLASNAELEDDKNTEGRATGQRLSKVGLSKLYVAPPVTRSCAYISTDRCYAPPAQDLFKALVVQEPVGR